MNTTTKKAGVCTPFLHGWAVILLLLAMFFSPVIVSGKTNHSTVTIELNYGADKEIRKIEVPWEKGMTVLEALEHAANVSTHPVGNYVFVVSIDGVEGKRGVMAWYYKVNGEHPKELAITNKVKAGDTITWLYTKDVCSATVDGKK
jgi:hypothetical protein